MELDTANINDMIQFWRKKVKTAKTNRDKLIAMCYVDAFQTVRINHGLELLPKKREE